MTTITTTMDANKQMEQTPRSVNPVSAQDQRGFQQTLTQLRKTPNKDKQPGDATAVESDNGEPSKESVFLDILQKKRFDQALDAEQQKHAKTNLSNQKVIKNAAHLLSIEKHQSLERSSNTLEGYSVIEQTRAGLNAQDIKANTHSHMAEKTMNPAVQTAIEQLSQKIQQLEPNKEARLLLSGKLAGAEIVIQQDGQRLNIDFSGAEKQLLLLKDHRQILQQRLQHCCPEQSVLMNFSSSDSDNNDQRSRQYQDVIDAWLVGGEDVL